jgi:hypothetical protein
VGASQNPEDFGIAKVWADTTVLLMHRLDITKVPAGRHWTRAKREADVIGDLSNGHAWYWSAEKGRDRTGIVAVQR